MARLSLAARQAAGAGGRATFFHQTACRIRHVRTDGMTFALLRRKLGGAIW
jgi:hypothetical protein